MKTFKFLSFLILQIFCILKVANSQGVEVGFYQKTCPNVEAIVKETTSHYISRAPTLAAPLLRMHFHDCFVRGCDGSVLLNSTKGNQAEKDAIPNQSLRGFQVIDAAKSALEQECPGIVSCSDILALAARDAVELINGPTWAVPLGRRDGRVSILSDALNNLPTPFDNFTTLKTTFGSLGLNVKDLVVLSGGHTIGMSHCFSFSSRMYNFTGKGDTDPNMDQNYIGRLKIKCKPGDVTTIVEMDPGSFKSFDTDYYTMVSKRRGLFASDAALLTDSQTKAYVLSQVNPYGSTFFEDFGESMIKMGKIGVLTGKAGEIRKHCAFRN
ncbi:PREDICTED: peroxidase 27-like [Nicotiana attenuata]|uniref:Peroxidase n=1 Tax=Nicotiana attenuata TaxID=49451 RepID=A0A314L1T0_NICAT|nr:PREDICTED: peroxidase 27-like [Nicotiana attenuata]OIT34984.1 peroxidase 27 [Nicotiana attenuata]